MCVCVIEDTDNDFLIFHPASTLSPFHSLPLVLVSSPLAPRLSPLTRQHPIRTPQSLLVLPQEGIRPLLVIEHLSHQHLGVAGGHAEARHGEHGLGVGEEGESGRLHDRACHQGKWVCPPCPPRHHTTPSAQSDSVLFHPSHTSLPHKGLPHRSLTSKTRGDRLCRQPVNTKPNPPSAFHIPTNDPDKQQAVTQGTPCFHPHQRRAATGCAGSPSGARSRTGPC